MLNVFSDTKAICISYGLQFSCRKRNRDEQLADVEWNKQTKKIIFHEYARNVSKAIRRHILLARVSHLGFFSFCSWLVLLYIRKDFRGQIFCFTILRYKCICYHIQKSIGIKFHRTDGLFRKRRTKKTQIFHAECFIRITTIY